MSSKKMEKNERREVTIYSSLDVSPGFYYDHEIKRFSPAQDLVDVKTEKAVHIKIEFSRKNFLETSRTSEVLSRQPWITDYVEENPVDAVLIKGTKCLEKRALEVPVSNEMYRVLSVFYKCYAKLLLCFVEKISDDELKTFEGHLNSTCSQSSYSVYSQSLLDKFVCGYIYPNLSKPGKRFEKFMYGVKEFCFVLQDSAVSTMPISAIVERPTGSHNSSSSATVRDSVSEGFKAKVRSESNINISSKTKNTVGTISSNNLATALSKGLMKQGSAGLGIMKSAGVKCEIGSTAGVSLGRGRGTVRGRGNSIVPYIQSKECTTTRVGESRTRKLDQECDNLFEELQNTFVENRTVVNAEQRANFGGHKAQDSLENNERFLHEKHEERKGIDMVAIYTLVQPNVSSSSISDAQNSPKSKTLADHHLQTYGLSSSCGYQQVDKDSIVSHSDSSDVYERGHNRVSNSDPSRQVVIRESNYYQNDAEQNTGQVIHGEKNESKVHLSNGKSTLTKSIECNKRSQEDNVTKSEKGIQEQGNLKNEIMSIQRSSHHKAKSDVQLSENSTCSVSYSECYEGSNDEPAFSTRSGNVKKETPPANELPRSDIKKSEYDYRRSQDTKKKDASESKVTEKGSNMNKSMRLTEAQRRNCNSSISENDKRKIGSKKEIKKGKNAEKEADPNMYSQVETNNGRQNELFQRLVCNEDEDEKSFLKIGKQDNRKSKNCKENPQMKSTFLEADKTTDDILGFQRKYYGVVNDTSLEKVILFLGASGSGKTTLVNLAANYFKEKKSADEELYHVVATSPTSEITAYTFCSAPDKIPITIIDTPGLNDSSGAEVRDHIQALKTFLANASASEFQIHAIGFVAQAYLVRLTSSERLVMDYVSTIFGQGVKDHLITLVTFADNQDSPPVVEAMKNYGVSFKLSLKFNSSALHNNKAEEIDDIDRVYWRICWRNWKKCMKTLRDLSPLSVSTMKAVQSEVFASTILKSVERDLTANLKTFFTYSKEDRISSKEASNVCSEIWNLAAVLHHFRRVNKGLQISREDILTEFASEICKVKQMCAKENICFLSLSPETPLIVSGLQVIRTMASLYKQSKSCHTKSNKMSRNVSEWTYCNRCRKDHNMERTPRGYLKKLSGYGEEVVALKCTNCNCPGDVHGVSKTKSPFHPDVVLRKTYTALQKLIVQYSFPNFPIPENWYLKFLDHLFHFEHTDFINDIRTLKK